MKSIATRLLFIIAVGVLMSSCSYQQPELVQLKDIKVTKFTKSAIELAVIAKVKNPNNYRLSIVNSDLDVFVNGDNMGKIDIKKKVHIKANSTDVYTLELVNKPKNFAKLGIMSLFSMIGSQRLKVNIKGQVKGRAGLISKKFDVDLIEEIKM